MKYKFYRVTVSIIGAKGVLFERPVDCISTIRADSESEAIDIAISNAKKNEAISPIFKSSKFLNFLSSER